MNFSHPVKTCDFGAVLPEQGVYIPFTAGRENTTKSFLKQVLFRVTCTLFLISFATRIGVPFENQFPEC